MIDYTSIGLNVSRHIPGDETNNKGQHRLAFNLNYFSNL
jgi:hypothetical protein